jgi:hypothetical protein
MNTQNKIAKWSVIVGIVIVLNLFFNYALSLVYKQPEYNAFCPMGQVITQPRTQNECTSKGGQWAEYGAEMKPVPWTTDAPAGYCDLQFTCRQDFESAMKTYNRNVFVVLVILGAISVLIGNFFRGNEVIGSSLSMAGVLSFIIASMRYWSDANDLIRVVILAIALALLFWIAMKKFRNNG